MVGFTPHFNFNGAIEKSTGPNIKLVKLMAKWLGVGQIKLRHGTNFTRTVQEVECITCAEVLSWSLVVYVILIRSQQV